MTLSMMTMTNAADDSFEYTAPKAAPALPTTVATVDLSVQYDCPASLTTVTFSTAAARIVARRFWRSDSPGTGKIELYTIGPDGWTEDFLGYVHADPARRGRDQSRAAHLIAVAEAVCAADTSERAAAIELR